MGVDVVALGCDLRGVAAGLLDGLLRASVESVVGLFGCVGVEYVDEAFHVMDDLMVDAQYFASIVGVGGGGGEAGGPGLLGWLDEAGFGCGGGA